MFLSVNTQVFHSHHITRCKWLICDVEIEESEVSVAKQLPIYLATDKHHIGNHQE